MLNHFIITRFNLRKEDWIKNKNSNPVLDKAWLMKRIKLFERFCFPSVVNQSCKNFQWLIFFEESSVHNVKEVLELVKPFPFIEAIFLNGYREFQCRLPSFIKTRMWDYDSPLITTRLDNDDALHEDFIRDIQESMVLEKIPEIKQFPYGFSLHFQEPHKVAIQHYHLNHFLSFIEKIPPNENPLTVFKYEHTAWTDFYPVSVVNKEPRWLQIIHEDNMANVFRGTLAYSRHLKPFHLSGPNFPFLYNFRISLNKILKRLSSFKLKR